MYCILVIKSDAQHNTYDALDLAVATTLASLLKQTFASVQEDAVCCDVDEQRLAVMLCYPSCTQAEFKHKAEETVLKVQSRLPVNIVDSIVIAGGNIVADLIQLPNSYEKAQAAFSQNYTNMHSCVLWYEEKKNARSSYYFPADMESQLIKSVKEGDKQTVQKVVTHLYKLNFEDSHLSAPLQKFFIYQLVCTLTKLSNQMEVDEKRYSRLITNLDHIFLMGELKQKKALIESFLSLCDAVSEKSGLHHDTSLTRQIVVYIKGHFCESSISLSSIASQFGMNESYLSYIFKQQNGVKLSVYIENLRIEKAKELLAETTLTIHQIAEKTGYLSSNSFCRAFKRVTGVNATAYRSDRLQGKK